jgi:hypothetical protein
MVNSIATLLELRAADRYAGACASSVEADEVAAAAAGSSSAHTLRDAKLRK